MSVIARVQRDSADEYWQGRVVDPTGVFFVYAGEYQPEAVELLRETERPAFVSVVGIARTYETDRNTVNVSLRPEHLTIINESVRHHWVIETAERTLDCLEAIEDPNNKYAQMARDEYGGRVSIYRDSVVTALESLEDTESKVSGTDRGEKC